MRFAGVNLGEELFEFRLHRVHVLVFYLILIFLDFAEQLVPVVLARLTIILKLINLNRLLLCLIQWRRPLLEQRRLAERLAASDKVLDLLELLAPHGRQHVLLVARVVHLLLHFHEDFSRTLLVFIEALN